VLTSPAIFRYQTAENDAVGPLAASFTLIDNPDQTFGFDLGVLWAYGGRSAYTVCQALANTDKTPLSKLVAYFQRLSASAIDLGQTPTVAIQIMEGQNDLNIEHNSGPTPSFTYTPGTDAFTTLGNAGASSRDGYKNDLLTIIHRLRDAWTAAGFDAANFYVILGPYHQIAAAPGHWKMELGFGRAEREIADSMPNVITIDGPKIVGYDEMIQANGYSADGGGATHLSRAGYLLLGNATGERAIRPLSGSGACCSGGGCVLTAAAACSGSFQGAGTSCGPINNPTTCCPANFNLSGGLSVQDVFDFLDAWFAQDPRADFDDSSTVQVQDIFEFLGAWFAGCG
jgi:hypothetical protein